MLMRNVDGAETSKMRKAFSVRRLIFFVILASAIAVIAVTVGVTARANAQSHYDHMTNPGVIADGLTTRDLELLEDAGGTAAARNMGTVGDVSFYETPSATGAACFAIGLPRNGVGVGAVACPPTGESFSFPSDEHPILDMSFTSSNPDTGSTSVAGLVGFAADGVASVGLIGPEGRLVGSTPVQNNLYVRRWAGGPDATAIVALDDNGAEIYRKSFPSP